jgi:hypothetical protein
MLPSGLPEVVGDDEDLTRFLTQNSQFKQAIVRPAAFLPSSKSRETSVSRHGREPLSNLWMIGLAAANGRPLYGAAILKAATVRGALLEVASDEPPMRHAAIRNWPWIENDPEEQKAQQKEIAIVLASAAGPPLLR